MRRALALAARGLGETNPNPLVGCVVVRGGPGRRRGLPPRGPAGRTPRSLALGAAGARARGATLYVTLEPCSHHGRTPPCAPLVRRGRDRARRGGDARPRPARERARAARCCARAGVAVDDRRLLRPRREALNARFLTAARARPAVRAAEGRAHARRPHRHRDAATRSGSRARAQRRQARAAAAAARRRARRASARCSPTTRCCCPQPRTRRPFTRVVLDTRLRLPAREPARALGAARGAGRSSLCGEAPPRAAPGARGARRDGRRSRRGGRSRSSRAARSRRSASAGSRA